MAIDHSAGAIGDLAVIRYRRNSGGPASGLLLGVLFVAVLLGGLIVVNL